VNHPATGPQTRGHAAQCRERIVEVLEGRPGDDEIVARAALAGTLGEIGLSRGPQVPADPGEMLIIRCVWAQLDVVTGGQFLVDPPLLLSAAANSGTGRSARPFHSQRPGAAGPRLRCPPPDVGRPAIETIERP
jgi:hypothetical protein